MQKEFRSKEDLTWHFIPANNAYFGSLWEAVVKLVKRHLNCIMGNSYPTHKEMCMLFCQIEACCNCRLITVLSTDP